MSMTAERGSAEPFRYAGERVAGAFMNAVHRIHRSFVARKNRRILEALPDEILRDIGLSRGNIHAVAARVDSLRRGFDELSVRRQP